MKLEVRCLKCNRVFVMENEPTPNCPKCGKTRVTLIKEVVTHE